MRATTRLVSSNVAYFDLKKNVGRNGPLSDFIQNMSSVIHIIFLKIQISYIATYKACGGP